MTLKANSVIEKTFFALLPMQIIMTVISSINSIIDGVIASNFVSTSALAVIALFMPVVKALDTINTIFLGGSQILCGQYIGKNQMKRSVSVFSTDMLFIFSVGMTATVLCYVFSRPIAALFVDDEIIISELCDYIRGFSLGIVPMMFIPQLTAFLQLERQEKRTYAGMTAMIVLNVSLDLIFVSVLDMGMLGLGLATSVSNLAFFIILVTYYLFKNPAIGFDIHEIRLSECKNIVHVGLPGAVSSLGQTVRSVLLNVIMLSFVGSSGISAFSAVYSFGCVYWAVSGGVANAVRVLSSIYAGEEDRTGLHTIVKTALTKGTALVSITAAFCMLCAPLFTRIFFGADAGPVYKMTLAGFVLFPLTMPLSCICCVFSNYYQCLNRLKAVNILMLIDSFLGVIAFSFILAPLLGMNGVWLAHIASGMVTLLIIFIYTWIFNKRVPGSVTDLLVLENDFGVSEEDRIDIRITDMKDVINLSEAVVEFSKRHHIDGRRAMFSGLCVEEMAGNIVKHGFDGKKEYNLDVRVIYKEDVLLIRLKDNCRPFNPKEVQGLFEPDDVTRNIGLRLVSRYAKEMSYNNCLGINVLNITV